MTAGLPDAAASRPPLPPASPTAGFLHFLTLWALGIAQPLYDLLARQPAFLVAHRTDRAMLLALVAILSLLAPALPATLILLLSRLSRRAAWACHLVSIAALVAVLVQLMLKGLVAGIAVAVAGLAAGALAAWAYRRHRAPRLFLTFLSPAVVIVPALFLAAPPVARLAAAAPSVLAPVRPPADAPPVVVVIFDELPLVSLLDGSLGIAGERFPAFARLAAEAHWFRNATSIADRTELAMPPILTGDYPAPDALAHYQDYPDNLITLLAGSHELRVFESSTDFCPPELCAGRNAPPFGKRLRGLASDLAVVYLHRLLPAELAARLPDISTRWKDFRRPETTAGRAPGVDSPGVDSLPVLLGRFLDSIPSPRRSTLYLLHTLFPHVPWKYLPSGREYGPVGSWDTVDGMRGIAWGDERWGSDGWLVLQGRQRHLLQVGYADRFLGELIARLEREGLYDPAILAVVADHGVSFRPDGYARRLSNDNYTDVLAVPFFLKQPGQSGGRIDDRNVETLDLLPTLAGLLGLELPRPVAGQDLLRPDFAPRPRKLALDVVTVQGISLPADGSRLRPAAAELVAAFGETWDSVYGLGEPGSLLGRAPGELPELAPRGLEVELMQPWLFDRVDPESGFLPARVVGEVTSTAGEPVPERLAIALNGAIRALTRTVAGANGGRRFSAMLPEDRFVAGRNTVEVYAVVRHCGGWGLVPTAGAAAAAWRLLATPGGREVLLDPAGQRREVVPGSLQGEFWLVPSTLDAWAADLARRRPPEQLVVFFRGRFLFAAEPRYGTPTLARDVAAELATCGFKQVLPDPVYREAYGAADKALRVFAVAGRVAAELPDLTGQPSPEPEQLPSQPPGRDPDPREG